MMPTLIDRYVLGLYVKALFLTLMVLGGMYVFIDMIGNFEELYGYAKDGSFGAFPALLFEYYGPRVLWVFDRTAGMMAMAAALFAVTWMMRTQELTAILSAGVRPSRVIRPIIMATLLVAGAGVANREIWLPKFRSQLARNAQDWHGEKAKNCTPQFDPRSDVLLSGKRAIGKERRIEEPLFRLLSPELAAWGRQISAESAWYFPFEQNRPAGYLLTGVKQPTNLAKLASLVLNGEAILLSPSDTPWLKPNECFVVSVVSFEQFSLGSSWRQNLSTSELVAGLKNKSLQSGADILVTMHGRFVQPLLDLTLVFLGLPLVLSRGNRNIFVAGAICLALMAAFFVVSLVCQGLGNNYLLEPTFAAWLPVLIFAPVAFTLARPLWD
jgi:lipopolysaccharide export system permease protein